MLRFVIVNHEISKLARRKYNLVRARVSLPVFFLLETKGNPIIIEKGYIRLYSYFIPINHKDNIQEYNEYVIDNLISYYEILQ